MRILYSIVFLSLWLLDVSSLASQESPIYSLYFLGSTGETQIENEDILFKHLREHLQVENKNSGIIFLGDNIKKHVVDSPDFDRSDLSFERISYISSTVNEFKGKVYLIPGNLDWNNGKSDGKEFLNNQEIFIEGLLKRGDVLIPDEGCPGPEKKKLGKNIVLLALDSQWWLQSHTDEQKRNSDCKNKDVEEVVQELIEHLDDDDDKQIIITLHHPIYTKGRYGGYFEIRDHLFPLTNLNSNLWIPLPVIGSVFPFYRRAIGKRQDTTHPLYEEFKKRILGAVQFRKNVILLSGHEHNFQYYLDENKHYINLGSGSMTTKLPSTTGAIFSERARSFGKLSFFENGRVNLNVYSAKDDMIKVTYDEEIIEPNKEFGKLDSSSLKVINNIEVGASKKYSKSGFHQFLFGKLNRDIWAVPVQHKQLDLSTKLGGLRPVKIGGGKTTKSIRLKDENKNQYVLRTVDKRTYKLIPIEYRNSMVEDLIQDQVIGASNPYGAVILPPLAEAAGIYHTNPEIFYLPAQNVLGEYNDDLSDQLYLFEERPSDNFKSASFFGNSRKIVSFNKMLENLETSPGHHVHQEQVLKSRLFDMLIGDWDRHDDQWRWASFKEPSHLGGEKWLTYYEPIPRDRDQAFYDYDGLISSFLKMLIPQLRIWQEFDDDIENMKYFHFSSKHFDRRYLTELEKKDWIHLANQMSICMTDEIIEESIGLFPEEINKIAGKELTKKLKERRNKLPKWAEDYYKYLSKYVDVAGSKFQDLFQAERKIDGSLQVKVYQFQKDGKLRDLIYQRLFRHDETKEVRFYGLSGDDIFQISGHSKSGPLIRIVGGNGKDVLNDKSYLQGSKKSVVVYDNLKDSGMVPGPDGSDKRSDIYSDNVYNRHEFYYNSSAGYPYFGFNRDEGVALQYRHTLKTYGFKKYPYAGEHNFGIAYYINKEQLKLDYSAIFTDVIGNTDVSFSSYFHLPNRVTNFFGLSNESSFSIGETEDFDYYRYDQFDVALKPALLWSSYDRKTFFEIGPYYRYIKFGDNEGKYLTDISLSGLPQNSFNSSSYFGLETVLNFSRVDNIFYPTIGIDFNIKSSYNINVNSSDERFTRLHGSLTLYNFLWVPERFVWSSKIEGGINFGKHNFNQAQYIGQNNGLRGYRNERFSGRSSLVVSNDLRIKLGTIKGRTLPVTYGIIGAYDFGRVWNTNEHSDTWHHSYGGGVFISPFDFMPVSLYLIKSKENGANILLNMGFAF